MKSPDARILYTEDDADTRELVTMVLGRENCQVKPPEVTKKHCVWRKQNDSIFICSTTGYPVSRE